MSLSNGRVCLLFFLLAVACFGSASLSTCCPDRWVAFQGSCYLFGHSMPLSFVEAEHYCRQHNSHLIQIETAIENMFIKDFLRGLKPEYHWLGLTDETVEGVWQWYDTQTVATYTDWSPGEPNAGSGDEDCALFAHTHDFKWIDGGCTGKVEPICEIRQSVSCSAPGPNRLKPLSGETTSQ